jgi:hypothetical protein
MHIVPHRGGLKIQLHRQTILENAAEIELRLDMTLICRRLEHHHRVGWILEAACFVV